MKLPKEARKVENGIFEIDMSEIRRDHQEGWSSLDKFVESAAMTMHPDAEFESQGETYSLLLDGTTILSRFEEPSPEDRYRLSSCAVVIFRGNKQRPLYFTNYDEGLDAWDNLCIDMGHPEAMFQDVLPGTGKVHLN